MMSFHEKAFVEHFWGLGSIPGAENNNEEDKVDYP